MQWARASRTEADRDRFESFARQWLVLAADYESASLWCHELENIAAGTPPKARTA
jgi:hypothetical protein